MKILTRRFKNRKLSNILKKATSFYLDRLGQSDPNIIIHIVQMPKLGADGTCEKISNKEFIIELNDDLGLEHRLLTLAHETIHIRQYLTKQLRTWYLKSGTIDIWEGKRFRNVGYLQQPWEIEALLQEEQLYIDFISECYVAGNAGIFS